MRLCILVLALAVLFAADSAASAQSPEPPLPPIVFQSQPVGRVLDDLRAGADIVGGEKGVQALNRGLKEWLGEKGFDGLDVTRPLVGYVVLAPKPEDITAVIAFPVTGENEFLALCDRVNKDKLKVDAKDKSLYHMPPLDPRYKAVMRFKERYAYIAYGANPMPHIDPKAIVPMAKLYDPAERGLVSARLHVDRIPAPVKLAAFQLLQEAKKTLFDTTPLGRDKDAEPVVKVVTAELEKLVARYLKFVPDVESVAARVLLDAPSGNLVVEATLAGKAGSELAKTVAAFKPTANKFGGIVDHPDSVGGFKFRLPLFEEELRNVVAAGLEAGGKEAVNNAKPDGKAAAEELFKGLVRTVKTGELDVVAAVRGPDKDGWFTLVGALAFEDTAKLEKEVRTLIEKDPPPGGIKWDAAKVGAVAVHTFKIPPGDFIDPTKVFGGDNCTVAFAFAPHGVFAAMGPDAVGTIKDALAVKPAPAPFFDVLINPVRTTKLIGKVVGPDDPDLTNVANVLGTENKLVSVMSATVEGGKELRAAFTLNLKVLPRAAAYTALQRADKVPPPAPVK